MVEDDRELCAAVDVHLRRQDYTVDYAHTGEDGLHFALQNAYDLILLDRMLPELDGVGVVSSLRRHGLATPVLMITALDGISDRVDGLDAGADDYLTKPFETAELMARLRAMLRRTPKLESDEMTVGDLRYERLKMVVTGPQGNTILSKKDARLLEYFLKNPGRTLTREQLFAHVWGPDAEIDESNLAWHLHYLRRALAGVGSAVELRTVRGVGYCLEAGC